ncbi:peptidoglycan-binding domain-containing protein [[Phormidium] sp. LEGE 05292]|uniref:peptidoglycan-binding domain-containing protein n=1 Tax=[Phormidium] sp. LEGE 05292 TaxID=767427 RepID=UPI001D151787|nr:peptidoglycan-binding domain-containing protein [Phormidium sp. LEGE 05292]
MFLFPVSFLMWYPDSEAIAQEKVANRYNSEVRIAASSEKQSTTEESTTDSNNTESSASTIANLPTLKIGMRSPEVFWVQKRLQAIGFFQGSVDGIFGKDTQAAVIAAQEKYGLKPDGIVGAATWQLILRNF